MPDATEVVLPFYDFVLDASFLHSIGGYNSHDTATYDGHIGLRAIDGLVRTVPVHVGHHFADTLCTTNSRYTAVSKYLLDQMANSHNSAPQHLLYKGVVRASLELSERSKEVSCRLHGSFALVPNLGQMKTCPGAIGGKPGESCDKLLR